MTGAVQHARTVRASQVRAGRSRLADPPTEELTAVPVAMAAAGSAARPLRLAAVKPLETAAPERERSRTPLTLIEGKPRRKVPFIVFCFGALAAALVTVLVLNISVATSQYELAALRNQHANLIKSNDQLAQQQQLLQSPQNLAAKARELGMVTPSTIGQVNVDTGVIAGSPAPAQKNDNPLPPIPGPQIQGQRNVAAQRNAATQQNRQSPVVDLGGGTIPSPQQRAP